MGTSSKGNDRVRFSVSVASSESSASWVRPTAAGPAGGTASPAGQAGTASSASAASTARSAAETGTRRVKRGMADMLKGGVIMDVVTPDQAKIAEDAGAVAVMALERVPARIRAQGGGARMSDPALTHRIRAAGPLPP